VQGAAVALCRHGIEREEPAGGPRGLRRGTVGTARVGALVHRCGIDLGAADLADWAALVAGELVASARDDRPINVGVLVGADHVWVELTGRHRERRMVPHADPLPCCES
jgi:hypothetical protein